MSTRMKVVSSVYKVTVNGDKYPELSETAILSGEIFAFQVVYTTDMGNIGNTLAVEGLPGDINIRKEHFVYVDPIVANYDDYYMEENVLPDILYPVGRAGLPAHPSSNAALWIEVSNVPAGKYQPVVVLRNGQGEIIAKAEFSLIVKKEKLGETDLYVTHWFHYDCMADVFGEEPFTDKYYRALEPWIKNYVAHGNNTILTPLFTPCLDTDIGSKRRVVQLISVARRDGRYYFNFDKLNKFLDYMSSLGVKYFEMSHLFTQWGAKCCPNIVIDEDGEEKEVFGWGVSSEDPSYRNFLSVFLLELTAYLKGKGVADRCLFHISDEPNEATVDIYSRHKAFLDEYLKGFTVVDALSSIEYADMVDQPIVAVDHVSSFLREGRKVWIYYCCGQTYSHVTNALIAMPALRTRMLGIQMFLNNALGFLQWGYNFYYSYLSKNIVNPYTDHTACGAFPAGDSFLVYPQSDGPLDSLRNQLFLQAMQDYRLCLTAAGAVGRERVVQLIRSYGWNEYTEYPRSEERFEKLREDIIELISI